jgi:hypothetical protein
VEGRNTVDDDVLKMEGTIEPNRFGGAGVSATGAANIYGQIRVSYP